MKDFDKFMHKLEEVLILEFTHLGGDVISKILVRMWEFKDWWNDETWDIKKAIKNLTERNFKPPYYST